MILGNGNTSKGKTLKVRKFHKSYVILTPFEEVYPKSFWSYAVCKGFPLSILLGNKSIATVFAIRRSKAKEKARMLARWVEHYRVTKLSYKPFSRFDLKVCKWLNSQRPFPEKFLPFI